MKPALYRITKYSDCDSNGYAIAIKRNHYTVALEESPDGSRVALLLARARVRSDRKLYGKDYDRELAVEADAIREWQRNVLSRA